MKEKTMLKRIIILSVLAALATTGASYAAVTQTLHVHNGDAVIYGKLGCVARSSGMTCGLLQHQKVTVTVNAKGGAITVGSHVRYVCLTDGQCVKP
jgi:hypothetical protein